MVSMSEDRRGAQIEGGTPSRWDVDALRAGVSVCVVLALPFRVLAAIVGGDSGGLNALFYLLFIAFFVIGSGCAAWVQRTGTPLSHALVTAIAAYVTLEAVLVVVRLTRGTAIPWSAILVTASVVLIAGVIGGFLGSRLQAKGFVPSSRR